MADNADNVGGEVFYLTHETTGEEFRAFIQGLIGRCGEASSGFPYRVLRNATKTTVFQKMFFVDMDGVKVEMKLVFLEKDLYFISWGILTPDTDLSEYAIFPDIVGNFTKRVEAIAVTTRERENHVRNKGIQQERKQNKKGRETGSGSSSSAPPQLLHSDYLLHELARGKTLPFGCSYVGLTRLGGECRSLTLDRYSLIRALQCMYNMNSERDQKKLAASVLRVLQMIPEPMRNSHMLDFVCEKFETGGRPEQALVDRQQEWSESSKKLHRVAVDSTNLTEQERLENKLLSEEWTIILPKTSD